MPSTLFLILLLTLSENSVRFPFSSQSGVLKVRDLKVQESLLSNLKASNLQPENIYYSRGSQVHCKSRKQKPH